jgi:hypothetical protein
VSAEFRGIDLQEQAELCFTHPDDFRQWVMGEIQPKANTGGSDR